VLASWCAVLAGRSLTVTANLWSSLSASARKRRLFTDPEFFTDCSRLSAMVSNTPADGAHGDTGMTVLLARLYADYIAAEKERPSQAELPKNVPELMLSYLNFLNRDRSDRDPGHLAVHRSAQIIAWECIRANFRSSPAWIKDVVAALGENASDDLHYIQTKLRIVRTVKPTEEMIKFTLDPVAEYLAGLHLVDAYRADQQAWEKFLVMADSMPGAPQTIKGFLLAVRDCCLARGPEAKVPTFVSDKLAKLIGLDVKALKEAEVEQRVKEQIARLSLPVAEDRWNAAKALGRIGPQANAALPALMTALASDKDEEVRIAAAISLGEIGTGDAVRPALFTALNDNNANVRQAAGVALTAVGDREFSKEFPL
jgi:NACHT conflict system protein/HEAT repeat protein